MMWWKGDREMSGERGKGKAKAIIAGGRRCLLYGEREKERDRELPAITSLSIIPLSKRVG